MTAFSFINSFVQSLPVDAEKEVFSRQVYNSCASIVTPTIPSNPKLLSYSHPLAKELSIPEKEIKSSYWTDILSGKKLPADIIPYAMCYGGHQF